MVRCPKTRKRVRIFFSSPRHSTPPDASHLPTSPSPEGDKDSLGGSRGIFCEGHICATILNPTKVLEFQVFFRVFVGEKLSEKIINFFANALNLNHLQYCSIKF